MGVQDGRVYVVYAFAADRYQAVKVPKSVSAAQIHAAIAGYENDENRSGRRWKAHIEPGSFNIFRVPDADDAAQAVDIAKARGLRYEPKPVVLARYQEQLQREAAALDRLFKAAGKQKPGSTPFDGADFMDGLFGDLFKGGPKR
ncbi:MAG: hypothetical protein H6867_04085 [Rhodospirillales bacterium]|nr:hypothetical protein [Rhodospirillales bacterium]MCB9996330.1 hypothetical protein [Rhodospirillales bacterium]